jgi:hypothetical protein
MGAKSLLESTFGGRSGPASWLFGFGDGVVCCSLGVSEGHHCYVEINP